MASRQLAQRIRTLTATWLRVNSQRMLSTSSRLRNHQGVVPGGEGYQSKVFSVQRKINNDAPNNVLNWRAYDKPFNALLWLGSVLVLFITMAEYGVFTQSVAPFWGHRAQSGDN